MVELADRYVTDRYLPDKAIDLIDEAAAKIKTQMHSQPAELDDLNRKIIHLETELAALKKDKEYLDVNANRVTEIQNSLKEFKQRQKLLYDEWVSQKQAYERIIAIKEEINATGAKIEKLQADGMYTEASKLLYVEMPKLKKDLESANKHAKSIKHDLFKTTITENEIAEVVSAQTGIPLKKLLESDKTKLLNLKKEMQLRVKGQNEALDRVVGAVLRGRARIGDPNRPIGSFLFLGPTGVGKTEVAKTLAASLFDSEKAMLRFDMSEYMEKHSVSKLIGAPPGYVGYDQPGALSESVRRHPYSVILLDEIEKAHVDVLNLFLQILDDGVLTDSQGHLINFKNTIIIMTSNVGSQAVLENNKQNALAEIAKVMRPEFMNRIDEVVVFNELTDADYDQIIDRLLGELGARLRQQQIFVAFAPDLKTLVRVKGSDRQFGARPLKRYIQRTIENFLAENIISGQIQKNVNYFLGATKEGKIALRQENKMKS